MPGFEKAFQKLVFEKVQDEADRAAKSLNEPGPSFFTRAELTSFDPDHYYSSLCSKAPLTMSALGGMCSRQMHSDMQVNYEQEQDNESSRPQPHLGTAVKGGSSTSSLSSTRQQAVSSISSTQGWSTTMPR